MKSLSALIQEKKEEIKKEILIEMTPKQAQWEKAKEQVKSLKANYEEVVKENLKNRPQFVKKRDIMGGTAIEVFLPKIEGFEICLYLTETGENEIKTVRYELWNSETSTVFIRDLLSL